MEVAKSVYSLVLADDVIAAIDSLATQAGVNRSALVNRILADFAKLPTPEIQQEQTLASTRAVVEEMGFRVAVTAGGTLTMHTALRYKYSPTLRYAVELWEAQPHYGRLQVSLRTSSDVLLAHIHRFFSLWQNLEQQALPEAQSRVEDRRFVRHLRHPKAQQMEGQAPEDRAGRAIAGYVSLMDSCLRTFMACLDDEREADRQTRQVYLAMLPACGGAEEL